MKRFRIGDPLAFRAALALVYTAALLLAFEFWWIPSRVEARLRAAAPGPRPEPSLEPGLQWVAACVVGYLLIPLLLVLVVHREKPASVGFSLRRFHRHVLVYLGLYLLMLPAVLLAARRPEFRNLYPFMGAARADPGAFLRWEVAYVIQFIALEAFFRGYLLFTLEKRIGGLAVFVMTVPYALIHVHKPPFEAYGSIAAGLILGSLALRFRSWAGGALLHALVAVTMDSLAVRDSGMF